MSSSDDSDVEAVTKRRPPSKKRPAESSDDEDSDDNNSVSSASSSASSTTDAKPRRLGKKKLKPKKKRNKPAASAFFENEATVNDEESEEEIEEREIGVEDLEEDSLETKRRLERRMRAAETFNEKSAEEIAAQIERRHNAEVTQQVWVQHDVTSREANLPTVTDPRLFLVKCKPGEEKGLVVRVMRKYLALLGTPDCPQILSVSSPGTKGFIYVEAMNEAHVQKALTGLRDVYPRRSSQVPLAEMTEAMTISEKSTPIKVGDLVRLRRFPYKADIARVVGLRDGGDKVVVQYVPRLDFAAFSLSMDERKERRARKFQPPKKFFNVDEVKQAGGDPYPTHQHGVDGYEFDGDFYTNGFIQKLMSARQVQVTDVNPTVAELQMFREGTGGADGNLNTLFEDSALLEQVSSLKSSATNLGPSSQFTKRDMVRVKEGDLKHLVGQVVAINGQTDMIRIKLSHAEIRGKEIELPAAQLMKFFSVGNHVKVTGGIYAGQTGNVVKVHEFADSSKEWVAVVFTDSGKEIQTLFRDLRESSEISEGLDSLGGYKMHDQIWLTGGQTGIITSVGNDEFQVMMQDGVVQPVRIAEIRGKRRTNRSDSALDKLGNAIRANDIVKVVVGANAGIEGTIKHMFRSILFIHSRMKTQHGGILVERSKNVQLSGVKFRTPDQGHGRSGRGLPRRGRGGGRNGSERSQEQGDMLVGKTVKIKHGPFKGYLGIVVNATEQIARVEVHSRSKTVSINREKVLVVGDQSGRKTAASRTGYGGQRGMGNGAGSATPLHTGSATPIHPSATPLHDPSATPSHEPATPGAGHTDAWNANNAPVPATPGGAGGWAPGYGINDRSGSVATPGNYIPATPGAGMHPPGGAMPVATPGASYYTEYATPAPATPHTPATPAMSLGGGGEQVRRGDRVRVKAGEPQEGLVGELMEISGSDGVIKTKDDEFKFVPFSSLVLD